MAKLRVTAILIAASLAVILYGRAIAEPLQIPDTMLAPVTFGALEGWAGDDHVAALKTFRNSCQPILRKKARVLMTRHFEEALRQVCERLAKLESPNEEAARRFFEENFRPVRIARLGEENGFLTGYYEPEVEGSRTEKSDFKAPIYWQPAGVATKLRAFANKVRQRIGLRAVSLDRAAIEDGALKGRALEICWLKDPVDAFFIQIQGSARVRLDDGKLLRINYDTSNGLPYTPVGRILIERGIIPREQMSMDAIRTYFAEEPEDAREIMRLNKSYAFFREVTGLSPDAEPAGAQGISLVRERSIAVDKGIHVYGTPFWIEADLPIASERHPTPWRRLMVAQDTGGAIIGPARADIYFGPGIDAGTVSGRIRHSGKFYMLVPNEADPSKLIDPVPLPVPRPQP
ncbi:MAG TPA: MltA domain-containing protein [Xanthobacteraceae bacterium]|nr:MltA domain-containing protein [Xanthobacteraceae bacterium]